MIKNNTRIWFSDKNCDGEVTTVKYWRATRADRTHRNHQPSHNIFLFSAIRVHELFPLIWHKLKYNGPLIKILHFQVWQKWFSIITWLLSLHPFPLKRWWNVNLIWCNKAGIIRYQLIWDLNQLPPNKNC